MDVATGRVDLMKAFEADYGKEKADEMRKAGRLLQIEEQDMTASQLARVAANEQPAVKDADLRSKLGKINNKARNKPCYCGSGRKFKACCMLKDRFAPNKE